MILEALQTLLLGCAVLSLSPSLSCIIHAYGKDCTHLGGRSIVSVRKYHMFESSRKDKR
jgi:hypothetical protein